MTPTVMPDERDERLMRPFLLGRLSESDRHPLEERFLADDDFAARLLELQNDLIDAYARGELDDDDRQAVAERLLGGSAGVQRLRFAEALDGWGRRQHLPHHVAPPPLQPRPARVARVTRPWLAAAALAVLSTSTAIWLGADNL